MRQKEELAASVVQAQNNFKEMRRHLFFYCKKILTSQEIFDILELGNINPVGGECPYLETKRGFENF